MAKKQLNPEKLMQKWQEKWATTLPDLEEIRDLADSHPRWMNPSLSPYGVVFDGYLDDHEIALLLELVDEQKAYSHTGCNAWTREYVPERHASQLRSITDLVEETNRRWWNFDVDPGCHAWLQSYGPGNSYQTHMDWIPMANRKLTAVAMLSDEDDYSGGDLWLRPLPKSPFQYLIPRTRGTVVVFLPWLLHDVSRITAGTRRTVNVGFWGPPLR